MTLSIRLCLPVVFRLMAFALETFLSLLALSVAVAVHLLAARRDTIRVATFHILELRLGWVPFLRRAVVSPQRTAIFLCHVWPSSPSSSIVSVT